MSKWKFPELLKRTIPIKHYLLIDAEVYVACYNFYVRNNKSANVNKWENSADATMICILMGIEESFRSKNANSMVTELISVIDKTKQIDLINLAKKFTSKNNSEIIKYYYKDKKNFILYGRPIGTTGLNYNEIINRYKKIEYLISSLNSH